MIHGFMISNKHFLQHLPHTDGETSFWLTVEAVRLQRPREMEVSALVQTALIFAFKEVLVTDNINKNIYIDVNIINKHCS